MADERIGNPNYYCIITVADAHVAVLNESMFICDTTNGFAKFLAYINGGCQGHWRVDRLFMGPLP